MTSRVTMPDREEKLRSEVYNMFKYVQRLKDEIATITKEEGDKTAFSGMSVQLTAIVDATEKATNTILQAAEMVEEAAAGLRDESDPAKRGAIVDKISEQNMLIMEACSFQDITGQRVSKVVGSLNFVESHVDAMVELWGREEIESLGGKVEGQKKHEPDGVVLDGPQMQNEAISQDEIDALFD